MDAGFDQITGRPLPFARGLFRDAPDHNLSTNQTGTESDLDALSIWDFDDRVYFSIDRQSAALSGLSPASIYLADNLGNVSVWASETQLGLSPDDDIDALAILDRDAQFNLGTVVYISLSNSSPSRALWSAGEEAIFQVTPRPVEIIFNSEDLNLLDNAREELNALSGFDPPPPPWDSIPKDSISPPKGGGSELINMPSGRGQVVVSKEIFRKLNEYVHWKVLIQ